MSMDRVAVTQKPDHPGNCRIIVKNEIFKAYAQHMLPFGGIMTYLRTE